MMISEKDFSQQVYDLARLNGWQAFRFPTWRNTGTTPGWPDLVLVRPGEMLLIELKAEKGRLSVAQRDVLTLLESVWRVRVGVARPSDWDALVEALKRVSAVESAMGARIISDGPTD